MFIRKLENFIGRHILIIFFLPLVIVLCTILLYPLVYAVITSFFRWKFDAPYLGRRFVGISQYIKVFQNKPFLSSVINTFIFSGGAVTLEFILGVGIAILLEGDFKGRKIFMAILFISVVVPPVGVGILWKTLLSTDVGIVPYLLSSIGFTDISLLGDPILAKASIIMVDVWATTPFVFVLTLTGLESLPPEPVEAAVLDGASPWQVFRYIKFPLIKPVILVVVLIRLMDTLRIFDIIYVMTGGGPGFATESVSVFIIRILLEWHRAGYGCAIALVVFAIIMVVSFFLIKVFKIKYIQ